jgi:purine-nucleoside phosphorylase
MSIHISAKKDTMAKTVLLAGDPLRAKFIAESFLDEAKLVSHTRNMLYFTGKYKNKTISVGSSGMGAPSMGIYSYELYTAFEVATIIRIGTCGAYTNDFSLLDLLMAEISVSESTYAVQAWGDQENKMFPQGNTSDLMLQTAASIEYSLSRPVIKIAKVHSSDAFYHSAKDIPAIAQQYGCDAVEMESFALFANAKHLRKNAAALLTVSDNIATGEKLSAEEREKGLNAMIALALETAIKIS